MNSSIKPVVSRVFKSGNSQAVRIPAEFRLDTDQVQVFRNENGDLVLHPIKQSRGQVLYAVLSSFDADFVDNLAGESDQTEMQDRELL